MTRHRGLLLALLLVLAGIVPAAGAAPIELPAWDWVPSASPGARSELLDVVDFGGGRVWAVGRAPGEPLVERWNGSAFVRVAIAGVPGRDDVLEGVDGVAPGDLWAVGHADRTDFVGSVSLTYHRTGTTWQRVPSPNAGDAETANELLAVAAVASDDVWAVGRRVDVSSSRALILHWDGTAWRSVRNDCGSVLRGVTALAADDVWAVGANLICHFDGRRWTPQLAPQVPNRITDLQDVDGVPGALWAVGLEFASCGEGVCPSGIVLRRSGAGWVREVEGYQLFGVTVLSPTDAWAVGSWAYGPLLLHRDATGWRPAPSPDTPGLGRLAAVDASAPSSLWAVGAQLLDDASIATLALQAPSDRSGAIVGQSFSHAAITWLGPESGTVESDQFGQFLIGGLQAGRYTVIASLPGCDPVSRRVRIAAGVTQAITLEPVC